MFRLPHSAFNIHHSTFGRSVACHISPWKTWLRYIYSRSMRVGESTDLLSAAALREIVEGTAPEFFAVGRMFIPSNLSFCISLLILAKIKSLVFYWVHRFSEQFIHT